MPITSAELEYPICDTDIWINVSKLNKYDIIFTQYENIFISDAVREEIENKASDDSEQFKCALDGFKNMYQKKKVYCMRLNNKTHFNEEEKALAQHYFVQSGINYNEETGRFVGRARNVGEKVSVIYASIHNLPMVLSRDSGADKFASEHFKRVPIKRYEELLRDYGYSEQEIRSITNGNGTHEKVAATITYEGTRANPLSKYKSKYKK